MLYLESPLVIEGVTVFKDHEDPLRFYYLPMMPRLTQLPDSRTGQQVPQISIIKFRGTAGNGGFLNFDCNIGVDQSILDDVGQQLKSKLRLSGKPILGPVPVIDGRVRLLLLGASTPEVTQPAGSGAGTGTAAGGTTGATATSTTVTTSPLGTPTGPKFVTKIDQAAKPALFGDNQAAFSVALDQSGVTVLEKAMQGELSPIGIVYALDYIGLRPAYNVSVSVDWDRVQKHLDEKFGVNTLFFSSDIETAVDKLIESRAIQINVDTFVPEDGDESGVLGRRDKAVEDVREMITSAFFTSSLDPVKEQKDSADTGLKIIRGIATAGIDSKSAMFSYKKVDYTRIDKKSLNFNMRERTAVRRSIYPQGHLRGLFQILRDGGLDLKRFVTEVDLDDDYFERRRTKIISRADFEEDSIRSLDVRLNYDGTPKNVILDANTPTGNLEWNSQLVNGKMKRDVTVSYKVTFKGIDNTERPATLTSPEQVTTFDNLEINPRELYGIVHVPIAALSFPFDRYPQIEVHTRYADPANGIRMDETFLLTKEKPEQEWKIFVRDPKLTQFDYKVIFRGADNRDLERPWVTSEDEQVFVRDPFPNKLRVDVVPNVPWSQVQDVFVDLMYEDKQNNILQQESLHFAANDATAKAFTVDLRNPALRRVSYNVSIIFTDQRFVEIPRSFTQQRRIIVNANMKGHRIVAIQPQAVDFKAKKIRELKVEARYRDDEAGMSFADAFTFTSADDRAPFEFDYVDAAKPAYEFRTDLVFTNGMTKATDWQKSDKDDLIIPIN